MRRFLVLLVALCAISLSAKAQTDTTQVKKTDAPILSPKDSLYLQYADFMAQMAAYQQPRFKLYLTENIYNLIKLDTATGALWQVQYEMNKNAEAMEVPINANSLLWDDTHLRAGRYELYPTNNMYTFILLDTEKGYTYQVQWSTDPDKRFRMRIF